MLQPDREHPWTSAYREYDQSTLPRITRHAKAIGDQAKAGDAAALKVVNVYARLYLSFDPVTHMLLVEALDAWETLQEARHG